MTDTNTFKGFPSLSLYVAEELLSANWGDWGFDPEGQGPAWASLQNHVELLVRTLNISEEQANMLALMQLCKYRTALKKALPKVAFLRQQYDLRRLGNLQHGASEEVKLLFDQAFDYLFEVQSRVWARTSEQNSK